MLKENGCANNLHPLEEPSENIRHEISAIPIQQLRRVLETYSHDAKMLRQRVASLCDSKASHITTGKQAVNCQLQQCIYARKVLCQVQKTF
jgi:hypothetical protein